MQLKKAITDTFAQLEEVLNQLSPDAYSKPARLLNNSSIGGHCRHLVEFFICLEEGYENGIVNYENRRRNKAIEQDKNKALELLPGIVGGLNKPEKPITLHTSYDVNTDATESYASSYNRELAYVLEHAIHHMALINVALKEVAPELKAPKNFGVAPSTVKHMVSVSAE